MPEDPEIPDLPSDAEEAIADEAREAVADQSPQGDSPAEAAEPEGDAAQPAAGINPAEHVELPLSDSLVEEQMVAELAAAEMPESSDTPEADDIQLPSMDFSKPEPESVMAQSAEFPQLSDSGKGGEPRSFELLMDVKLPVSIELGRTTMAIADILALGGGSVVELDKLAGEPVDLLVNSKIIAQGEVVVVDENFGIRITNLVSPQERIKSL